MKQILTEESNPASINIDTMNTFDIVKLMNEEDKKVAIAVEKVLPQITEAVDLIVDAFLKEGRLAYFGAGTSGRLGVLDASETYPTFGVGQDKICSFIAGGKTALYKSVEKVEDSYKSGIEDLKKFQPTPKDVIVGISAGGNTPYVITVLKEATRLGCKTIGISSNENAKLAFFCDVFINPLVGEEIISGSSRMKSGTAQKMILNMLSTASMIRIGKTYKNYMVDLQPINNKLKNRAIKIISEIAKVPHKGAAYFLKKANNHVKVACIMAIKKISKKEANKLLNENKGVLRKIIS